MRAGFVATRRLSDREEVRMRLSVAAIVICGLVMSCAEPPTQPRSVAAPAAASFTRPSGEGATIVHYPEFTFPMYLPTGSCTFTPDDPARFNNFIRINPDGSWFLNIEDQTGSVVVTLAGGGTWTGTGRINVLWPNFHFGDTHADFFEETVVGRVSRQGETATVVCKDRIANGIGVEQFIKLN
jgi:hypothetical protein